MEASTTPTCWAPPGWFTHEDKDLARWRWSAWAHGHGEGGSEPTQAEATAAAREALARLQADRTG